MEPRKHRKKPATKAVTARRVEEILRIRLDGAEFWDVREYAREMEQTAGSIWELAPDAKPLSDGQLRRYVARADKLVVESCRAHRKKLIRKHAAQRRNLYAKAVSAGDFRAALAALDSEAKLLDLYPAAKHEVTGKGGSRLLEIVEVIVDAPSDAAPENHRTAPVPAGVPPL